LKLIGDLFLVQHCTTIESGFVATIELNRNHIIYQAHFPGYPVTPGVVQLQIVKELMEDFLGKKVELVAITQCKFMKILNPEATSIMDVHITFRKEDLMNVKAGGRHNQDIFFKLESAFRLI
jgi:3-hydroxyacyl-[acyl-carrier-protein] dehydratase